MSMDRDEAIRLLRGGSQGVERWNAWLREECSQPLGESLSPYRGRETPEIDLSGANLRGADLTKALLVRIILTEADLRGAIIEGGDLAGSVLSGARLDDAKLRDACLGGANLMEASLVRASAHGAKFHEATFVRADLTDADLEGADLKGASLIDTKLNGANLANCYVYGISAWNLELMGATQTDLVISSQGQPTITVDYLEMAQFIHLLSRNEKLRQVIETLTAKTVLILGRFTEERKRALDAMRHALRKRNYCPVMFDFDKPTGRTTDETVNLLARMARFIIADLTDPSCVLQELREIAPNCPSVPILPLLLETQQQPGMFDFFRTFPAVLEVFLYSDEEQLIDGIDEQVIRPLEAKVPELRRESHRG